MVLLCSSSCRRFGILHRSCYILLLLEFARLLQRLQQNDVCFAYFFARRLRGSPRLRFWIAALVALILLPQHLLLCYEGLNVSHLFFAAMKLFLKVEDVAVLESGAVDEEDAICAGRRLQNMDHLLLGSLCTSSGSGLA